MPLLVSEPLRVTFTGEPLASSSVAYARNVLPPAETARRSSDTVASGAASDSTSVVVVVAPGRGAAVVTVVVGAPGLGGAKPPRKYTGTRMSCERSELRVWSLRVV